MPIANDHLMEAFSALDAVCGLSLMIFFEDFHQMLNYRVNFSAIAQGRCRLITNIKYLEHNRHVRFNDKPLFQQL
jgi:hypothetical protein